MYLFLRRPATLGLVLLSLWAAASSPAQEVYILKRVLIADTEAKVSGLAPDKGVPASVHVEDVPLLSRPDFAPLLASFIGRPIDNEVLNGIVNTITQYAREQDRLIAKVLIPTQDITRGALRLAVVIGTYNELTFQGNRWFSRAVLEKQLGIKPGDEVRLSTLEEAVNWVNTNPFRLVKVLVNDLPQQPGKANLVVGVQEMRPFRAAFSVDNTGNPIIGTRRYAASFQFGNLWGRDHQGSYQFLTTDDVGLYKAHALDYRVPLRSRHFIGLRAHYVETNPELYGGLLTQKGESMIGELRYTIPLKTGMNPRELYFGVNLKESNNNLEFGGFQVLSNKTNTFHLFAGGSLVNRQPSGVWMLGTTVNVSPGHINSRNTDAALQSARSGAESSYIYGSLTAQRLQPLAKGWEVFSRAVVQWSSHNLMPTEQLTIGGSGSVRGYGENGYAAENGFIFNTDLMTPIWRRPLPLFGKKLAPIETRFLGFLDMAKVEYRRRFGADINFSSMASAGLGMRASLANNLSVSFDYGWQLAHLARQPGQAVRPPRGSRGHIKAVLAF